MAERGGTYLAKITSGPTCPLRTELASRRPHRLSFTGLGTHARYFQPPDLRPRRVHHPHYVIHGPHPFSQARCHSCPPSAS
jgi:hypothetical protein